MSTAINSELNAFEDLARSFASKELAPNRQLHDRYPFGPSCFQAVEKAFAVGLPGITLPEEYGGIGQGMSALCIILAHICEVDASMGGILFTHALAQEILLRAGDKQGLERIAALAGEARAALIAFPAYTNPGEILPGITAVKADGAFVLSGRADYVVLGGLAGQAVLPARIAGQAGYALFLVDLSATGLSSSEPVFSLGLHACPAVDLSLTAVQGVCVGRPEDGARYYRQAADRMQVAAAAMACGILRGSFQEALAYSQERYQGGREIINWTSIRMLLANMAVQVKITEMAVAQAAQAVDDQAPEWELAARAAAIHAHEAASALTTDGIQILGGNGYMKDYGQEQRFRDANQAQSLLGIVPMRKLAYLKDLVPGCA